MLKDGQTVKYPGTKNDPYIRAPEDKVAFKSTETMNFGKKKKKISIGKDWITYR